MRQLLLLVLVISITHKANADTWVVSREIDNNKSGKQCTLRSPIVNAIEIRFNGLFFIVSREMLDDLPSMMGFSVDQRDFIAAHNRDVSPYKVVMSDTVEYSAQRTKNIIAQFISGSNVKVSVETILNGTQTAEITLIGFTKAYDLYLSCKESSINTQ